MMKAGVSKDVIRTYVENAPPLAVTADDIITLKEQSVPDEITTALLKRNGEWQMKTSPQDANPGAPQNNGIANMGLAPAAPMGNGQRMDPESYEFWWYHYAYPRTLAYAQERLYPYYSAPYPYPLYQPWPINFAIGYPRPGNQLPR